VRHSTAILRLVSVGLLAACGAGQDLTLPDTGELTVTVSTAGDQLDPDGYTLRVDGGTAVPLELQDTLPVGDLDPGEHRLELDGIAGNCVMAGPNPLTITVVAGTPATATFQVSCTGSLGSGQILVRVVTTGTEPDPDGYEVVVDPLPARAVGTTDTTTFEGLTAGTHAVRLGGVASSCEVRGQNPRSVELAPEPASTLFEVACWPPPSGTVAFLRGREQSDLTADLFVVNANGTGLRNLTGTPDIEKTGLSWSPDWTTLAYDAQTVDENGFPDGGHGIYLVPASGAQSPQLLVQGRSPRWAPDGSRIAYQPPGNGLEVITPSSGQVDVVVPASADSFVGTVAWSPDNARLAFVTIPPDGIFYSLSLVDPNGANPKIISDQSRLSGDYFVHGWQPGGSKLLMTVSEPHDDLYLVDTTASIAPINLTEDQAEAYDVASWSPDGSTILFIKWPAGADFGAREIYTLRVSDRVLTKLSPRPGDYTGAAWSPDGTHVVYVEEEELFGSSSLFTVNADGTGLRQLTGSGRRDREPLWGP